MSIGEHLKVLVSYVRALPSPRMVDEHKRLSASCDQLKRALERLEQENAFLKRRLNLEGTFCRNNGAYYFETPEGHQEPFCSRCWDIRGKLVRLQVGAGGWAVCPQCKTDPSGELQASAVAGDPHCPPR